MAGVFIDIPGVGTVEAKNAASEQTLRDILKALGGTSGGAGRPGGGGAGGGGAGGGGAGGRGGASGATRSLDLLGIASNALGKSLKGLGFIAGGAVGAVGLLATGTKAAAGAAVGLSEAVIGAVEQLSRMGDSVSSAAAIFKSIPLIGPIFAAVAGAADDVTKSYNAVAASGATFGGSISNFARSASEAGMTMEQFAGIIRSNGQGMLGFGGTVESGAQNFAKVAKQVRTTGADLYALGFSTQEINQGLANYGALLRQQGLQGKKSNAELAAGAKKYLKEMDALAKITGEERSAKEAQAKQLANDAKFQAAMAGLNEEVRASFRDTVLGLPGPLQDFTKDILANGTATTEETQKLMAMMPQSAAMLQRLNAKMQRGEQVTMAERNALNNLMRQEGGRQLQHIKTAGAASQELAGTVNSLAATQQINANAVKEATEEQKKAQAETDKMNQKMQQFQQSIAEVSNKFKMLLANSGILDVLMEAFGMVVSLAEQYLVPAFNLVVSGAMKIWEGFKLLLSPVVEYLSEKFGTNGLAGTVEFIDGIFNAVFPILSGIVRGAIFAFEGLYDGVMIILQPLKELWNNLFGVSDSTSDFGKILIDVGAFAGEVFRTLGEVIGAVIKVFDMLFTPLIKNVIIPIFKALWDVTKGIIKGFAGFMDMLQDVGMFFDSMFDMIMFGLNKLTKGLVGIDEEEYKKRQEARADLKKQREAERAARERDTSDQVKKSKEELDRDSRKFKETKLTSDRITATARREAEAREQAVRAQEKLLDYTAGPEELLRQFSGKQGGTVELGIKKGEIQKEKETAQAQLAIAQDVETRKAAQARIDDANKKLKALEEAQALAMRQRSGAPQAAAGADNTRRTIENEAETRRTEQQAERTRQAQQTNSGQAGTAEGQPAAGRTAQENPTTLLQELNNKMARLIQLQAQTTTNTYETVVAAKGLSKDLFRSV